MPARPGSGRKPPQIDPAEVFKLAAICCTDEDIAGFFGVNQKTIQRWKHSPKVYRFELKANSASPAIERSGTFLEIMEQGKAVARVSLRRKLYNQAETKPASAIFLAKNILGYRDAGVLELRNGDAQEHRQVAPEWLELEVKQQQAERQLAATRTDGITTPSVASEDSMRTSAVSTKAIAAPSVPGNRTQ